MRLFWPVLHGLRALVGRCSAQGHRRGARSAFRRVVDEKINLLSKDGCSGLEPDWGCDRPRGGANGGGRGGGGGEHRWGDDGELPGPRGPLHASGIVGLLVSLAIAEHLVRERGDRFALAAIRHDRGAARQPGGRGGQQKLAKVSMPGTCRCEEDSGTVVTATPAAALTMSREPLRRRRSGRP